jgi:hypothetical protein
MKAKKNKVVIKGFVPVGIILGADFYYSKTQNEFVGSPGKLFLGDLYKRKEIDPKKLMKAFPKATFKGIAKIKLTIRL